MMIIIIINVTWLIKTNYLQFYSNKKKYQELFSMITLLLWKKNLINLDFKISKLSSARPLQSLGSLFQSDGAAARKAL